MIEEYYPTTRPPVKHSYTPNWQRPVTPPVIALPHVAEETRSINGAPSAFETARASKMGLDVPTYRHRVTEVSRAQTDCRFQVGDVVYPVAEADYIQYGMCQVVGVCRHYNDYGTVDWHEPPFILSVQSVRDRTEILNTTANWVTKMKPNYETTEIITEC